MKNKVITLKLIRNCLIDSSNTPEDGLVKEFNVSSIYTLNTLQLGILKAWETRRIIRHKNEFLHSIDSQLHEHEEESPNVLHQSL